MPYKSIKDLPNKIRNFIPTHAQKIYLKVYNSAVKEYEDPQKRRGNNHTKPSSEVVAHKVAWAAVKKRNIKKGYRTMDRKIKN